MRKSLFNLLFAFIAVGALKKGLKTSIGAIVIPIFFIVYLLWFFSGMPGVK